MYRAMDIKQREREIGQIAFQLDVIESLALGPYLAGDKITAADAALLPTFVFMNFMLPKFFHWGSVFTGRPKLEAWWRAMCADDAGRRIVDEVRWMLVVLVSWLAGDCDVFCSPAGQCCKRGGAPCAGTTPGTTLWMKCVQSRCCMFLGFQRLIVFFGSWQLVCSLSHLRPWLPT